MSALYDLLVEQLKDYNLGVFSVEKREERIATCQACENFVPVDNTCNVCKCNIGIMVMLGANSCKVGKWIGETGPEPLPPETPPEPNP